MEKYLLAQELRERQYKLGRVERCYIDILSDDDIIHCYTTCSCCGSTMSARRVQLAIGLARNAERFFSICNALNSVG
jgi:hypothetical protein